MRLLGLIILAITFQSFVLAGHAQRLNNEQIVAELSALRTANAELGAKITGLESDKSALYGKVETLEFLLSQSRDQINAMQGDDAEIGRLIGRLERRLSSQSATITGLEAKIAELETQLRQPAPALAATEPAQPGLSEADNQPTRIVSNALPPSSYSNVATSEPSAPATSGPTRITRRTIVNGETVSEVTTTQSASVTSTVATPGTSVRQGPETTAGPALAGGASAPQPVTTTAEGLPQGSLGTISASALPGEAGPLFAEAKSRLLQFDYAGAEDAFRAFLTQFSDDPQAGEAQYWLAEVLYQQEAYPESGQAYTTMIRSYPDDPRAPEALAKLARSMRLVGDLDQACAALNLLPTRYPNASGVTRNLAAGERVRAGCDS